MGGAGWGWVVRSKAGGRETQEALQEPRGKTRRVTVRREREKLAKLLDCCNERASRYLKLLSE